MNEKVVSIVVIVIVIVGGVFLFNNKSGAPTEIDEINIVTDQMPVPGEKVDEMAVSREFTLEAKNFSYSLAEIRVKQGETVHITLKNTEGVHDFKLDEFGAGTKTLQAGEEETIEFVADKIGSFEYYCSIGNHRAQGMVGTLIVEEK